MPAFAGDLGCSIVSNAIAVRFHSDLTQIIGPDGMMDEVEILVLHRSKLKSNTNFDEERSALRIPVGGVAINSSVGDV